jgi:hypothetical protein
MDIEQTVSLRRHLPNTRLFGDAPCPQDRKVSSGFSMGAA